MRPAQKAPENYFSRSGCAAVRIDFNEAGAKSAGKLRFLTENVRRVYTSMRPAQKAPENVESERLPVIRVGTSMRPAQKAPENESR